MGDIPKRFKRQSIPHYILHHGFVLRSLSESVEMNPLLVRTFQGRVDKIKRGIPLGDFGLPSQWNTAKSQLIVNQATFLNVDRLWGDDVEIEFGWSNSLQVSCVCKEFKNLCARALDYLRSLQNVFRHSSLLYPIESESRQSVIQGVGFV